MTNRVQQNVFGETAEQDYHFEIEGRTIRPWKQLIDCALAHGNSTEYKPYFTSDGWVVEAVDPANVMMVQTELPSGSFESYDSGSTGEIGLSKEKFGGLLQHTRYGKSTSDIVTLSGDRMSMQSHVSREMHGSTVDFSERRDLPDPKSLRERPDLPDLEFETEATIPVQTFINIVESIDQEHVNLQTTDDGIRFAGKSDVSESVIDVETAVSGDVEQSYYSMSYVEDMANALHSGKVNEITMKWDDEFPLFVEFDREDTYSGTIMLAPRITPD
jgi:DNA polymerase III sliding clamp (beta) subunit (PCNA family)